MTLMHAVGTLIPIPCNQPSAPRAGDLRALDDVRKLDASNSLQMEVMYRHFSHNMAAIDFWLNSCVFPCETQQYPQRLVANAWHLADNPGGRVVGFSGTNDNHRLLPLQVKQHLEVEDMALRATNGKMLGVMLANRQYDTLHPQVRLGHTCGGIHDLAASLWLDGWLSCCIIVSLNQHRSGLWAC
jgi:hypothetical protein